MVAANHLIFAVISTLKYWYTLTEFIFLGRKYSDVSYFKNDLWAKVQIFSLSLTFLMWVKPHYRSRDFQDDLIKNLQNVAIPGTGIPLSWFCYNYWTCLVLIMFINPIVCLLGAMHKESKTLNKTSDYISNVSQTYLKYLLHPDDWFSFWQLNCRLTSYQSLISKSNGFEQENKWKFLVDGKKLNIPVTPYYDIGTLVCKNINIEGGLGIHFFKNAMHGGDWILQEKLYNAAWLKALLPESAPLSTMRVITTSTWSLDPFNSKDESDVTALSAVLRLGLANADTDHKSVLFNVDLETGIIGQGATNLHWYQLGTKAFTCPWLPPAPQTEHPDLPGVTITGKVVPNMDIALQAVTNAHLEMMPDVPIVGWDVAFTDKGIFLLEVNLSCNFFRGQFNVQNYLCFVDCYWGRLSRVESEKKVVRRDSGVNGTGLIKTKNLTI